MKNKFFKSNQTLKRLDKMLTDAIGGEFEEDKYDETELSRLESKWRAYLTHSKMSMQQVEQEKQNVKSLLSDISHQTKTPLANILLYSELLREQELNEDGEELVSELHRQAEKLEFLIQSLVKMSRLETNVLEVKPIRQSLEPLWKKVSGEIEMKADAKGIKVTGPAEYEEAVYDLKWTEEALFNIVDNALKYSPAGSTVQVSIKKYNMYVSIRVSDEGIGIKESEHARIFQRFYRGEAVQQQEGIGIGLYLAREIVCLENGYIKVHSRKSGGTVFEIYLKC